MACTDEPQPLIAVTQQLNELLSEFQASVAAARCHSRNSGMATASAAAAGAAASSHCGVAAVNAEDSLASSFEDMQGWHHPQHSAHDYIHVGQQQGVSGVRERASCCKNCYPVLHAPVCRALLAQFTGLQHCWKT
jgi:hypothetical protein